MDENSKNCSAFLRESPLAETAAMCVLRLSLGYSPVSKVDVVAVVRSRHLTAAS